MVGTIDFQLDGKTIEQHPLVVMQEVKEGNFFSRIWDMVMMKLSQWFGGSSAKYPDVRSAPRAQDSRQAATETLRLFASFWDAGV